MFCLLIEGTGRSALSDPNAIILTQSLAKKYFGEDSPINQTIFFERERPLTVKGVVEDSPSNQHFIFKKGERDYLLIRIFRDCKEKGTSSANF